MRRAMLGEQVVHRCRHRMGVLLALVAGAPLEEVFAELVLGPTGVVDTGDPR